jgi:hypothetical protein
MNLITCIHCGPKAACLFAPSEIKKPRPACRMCRAALRKKYTAALKTGRGNSDWRKSNKKHFWEGGRTF